MSTHNEPLSFTFPEARQYWIISIYRDTLTLGLWGLLFLATTPGNTMPADDTTQLIMTGTVLGTSLAVSLAYWSRINKLTPRINQRFAIELMLRTGHPTINEPAADVTHGKHTINIIDQNGHTHYWSTRRKRGTFIVTPA
jgi:hypothetical protein